MIRYGAGKLANVKETLNGVVGIARFSRLEFYFTVRLASAAAVELSTTKKECFAEKKEIKQRICVSGLLTGSGELNS